MAEINRSADLGPVIEIWPRASVYWSGSSEQLVAERVLPRDFVFPSGRNADAKWDDDEGFSWWLLRSRPGGVKGRKEDFDYWSLRRTLSVDEGKGFGAAYIYEKKRALDREIWKRSPAGMRLTHRAINARTDAQFQAFLVAAGAVKARKKPGRKATVSTGD
jgi:hypothetical protein